MSFINKEFKTEDKIKMFQQLGSIGAVLALVFIAVIESEKFPEYIAIANMGLTAMIVVLAVSLAGSLYYKRKLK